MILIYKFNITLYMSAITLSEFLFAFELRGKSSNSVIHRSSSPEFRESSSNLNIHRRSSPELRKQN